jgi:hypothetical protein
LLLRKTPHRENLRPRAGFNVRYKVVQEEEKRKKWGGSSQAWPFIEEGG